MILYHVNLETLFFFCASKDSIRNNKLTLTLSQPCSLLKHGAVISELCNVTHLTGNAEYSVLCRVKSSTQVCTDRGLV